MFIRVKAHANHCSDAELYHRLCRSSPAGDGCWKEIRLVDGGDYDYFVIFNHPQHLGFDASRTIFLQSEPWDVRRPWDQQWLPHRDRFFRFFDTRANFNVDGWYHSLTYADLLRPIVKNRLMSGVVGRSSYLPGHVDRLRFVPHLDLIEGYDHFGRGAWPGLRSFKGEVADKQDALLPYRYTFNAENSYERNYFTEKILDPILCECLCFYSGCPNVEDFIDPRAFIRLDLGDPERAVAVVRQGIADREWERRLPFIRQEKRKLMERLNPLNVIRMIIFSEI